MASSPAFQAPTGGADKLVVKDLSVCFGGIRALQGVSFSVRGGSITALIGPNGAGKTTVFNCITGFYRPHSGRITLWGNDGRPAELTRLIGEQYAWQDCMDPARFLSKAYYKAFGGTHLVARQGIARTFQNIRLFPEMSVIENLLVAQHRFLRLNPLRGLLNTRDFRREEERAVSEALTWLDFVGLRQDGNRLAGQLPYGHQRRVEIARAMITRPEVVCLDEPAAGLNPRETVELANMIQVMRDRFAATVVVIEHDMGLVMEISDEIVVLNYGEVIAQGSPSEVRRDPKVLEAYLGSDDDD